MFVTLYTLYRAFAYLLGYLWSLASALPLLSPFRLTIGLQEGCAFITITYHPTAWQHVVVNVVMYICMLIVFLHAARSVLVGKKVPANRVRSYHASLKQMNEAMETVQKEKGEERFQRHARDYNRHSRGVVGVAHSQGKRTRIASGASGDVG